MTALLRNITFDCTDPAGLSAFWVAATGYTEDPDDPNVAGDPEYLLIGPHGWPRLLFVRVPERKTAKNRVHLDLEPTDLTRDEQAAALIALGARLIDDQRLSDGRGWVVLADPEGNELCLTRSAAERAASPGADPVTRAVADQESGGGDE